MILLNHQSTHHPPLEHHHETINKLRKKELLKCQYHLPYLFGNDWMDVLNKQLFKGLIEEE